MARRDSKDPRRAAEAYPELWRLLIRQPAGSQPWRNFWLAFIPAWVPAVAICTIGGIDQLSLPGLAITAGSIIFGLAVHYVRQTFTNPQP